MAPHSSAMATARGRTSLKLSIRTSVSSSNRTGAIAMTALTTRTLPEDLDRCHQLSVRSAALECDRGAKRQRNVKRRQHAEAQIRLAADVAGLRLRCRPVDIRQQPAGEDGRPQPRQVQARRAGPLEKRWRQFPLDGRFHEVPPANRVELHARKGIVLAVSFFIAVIDIVVAEGAEIKVRERILRVLR